MGTVHSSWPLAKSAHRLAVRHLAISHTNPTMCSLFCRWPQRSALQADRESFLFGPARILDGRAQLYSSELSYSYCMTVPSCPYKKTLKKISNFFASNSAKKGTILVEILFTIPLYPRKVLKIVLFRAIFCTYLLGPRRKYGKWFF